ncbi:ABC transporter substrate-binding protein [Microbacterium kribbense]|uniref:ABC transporter substrate-binding protein n=1 Tax=Microbacterium kribbense TaxID=433645 RepID=A0ABP7G674_9MICO
MRMNRWLAGIAAAAAGALALAGCAGGGAGNDGGSNDASAKVLNIGINQLLQHPALDAATEGFKKAFFDAGYIDGETVKFDEQNANGEQATAVTIANKFAGQDLDLVLAVATPAAQATAQAITDIPVVFTAVTDPEAAGIVDSWEKPGANVTGVSDLNPVAEQIGLVRKMIPDAKTVGVAYSSGEVNSAVQVAIAKEAAADLGLTIKEATISNPSELGQAVASLGDVDAIWVPTDNGVGSAIEVVVQYAEKNKIPMFVADATQVESGGVMTVGLDYSQIGYQTGQMALDILENGKDPASMPVEMPKADAPPLTINLGAAKRMGLEIPQSFIDTADKVIE